jgi:hypothetical protein
MGRPRSDSRLVSRPGLALCLAVSVALGSAAPSRAAVINLVQNGDFEQTLIPGSAEFGSAYPSQQVTSWATTGYNFIFAPGTADTTGATGQYGNLKLWGPNDGSANGLPSASPSGGNYIGADGAYNVAPITQTINGLSPGSLYSVVFWWAGAQQSGFTGATTEQWQVTLGTSTQSTSVVALPSQGFTGWMKQSFTYLATSTSEVLSFLAVGTPAGVPPFALLDGVSVTKVPEPASITVLLVGIAGLAGAVRLRNRGRRPATTGDQRPS